MTIRSCLIRNATGLAFGLVVTGAHAAAPDASVGPSAPALGTTPTLTVCINEGTAPIAHRSGKQGDGYDVRVSQAVARELGRPLAIRWFESGLDDSASLTLDSDAMLSAGLCDVVSGYALYAPALGTPGTAIGRAPDYDGARPRRERPWITLGTLIAGRPYHASTLSLLVGPKEAHRDIRSLADLQGMKIGSSAGTLGDAVLRLWRGGRLVPSIVSKGTNADLLAGLDAGEYDAVLVDLHRLDGYREGHPETAIARTAYRSAFVMNFGYVALESNRALLAQIDDALVRLERAGTLAQLAGEVHMTFLAPQEPAVRGTVTIPSLMSD